MSLDILVENSLILDVLPDVAALDLFLIKNLTRGVTQGGSLVDKVTVLSGNQSSNKEWRILLR